MTKLVPQDSTQIPSPKSTTPKKLVPVPYKTHPANLSTPLPYG
jgi:hypothetical protein